MDIDANEIGRRGYEFLCNSGLIPDVSKKDLTIKQREKVVEIIKNVQKKLFTNDEENKDKTNFLMFLYSSVICYIENTDLNKYLKISSKKD